MPRLRKADMAEAAATQLQSAKSVSPMDSARANPAELPLDLTAILDDLEKSDQQARRIAGGLSDAQANWQPQEGAWSIAQCLHHLSRASVVYSAALHEAIRNSHSATTQHPRPIRPGWFSRFVIASFEPPPKRKLRAPKKIVPASRMNARDVLEAFLNSHEAVRAVIREGAGLDLNQIRFRNPFIGFLRFTVGTGLLIIAAHERRHLWQAGRVREHSSFPSA